jgi:hypothetical protein
MIVYFFSTRRTFSPHLIIPTLYSWVVVESSELSYFWHIHVPSGMVYQNTSGHGNRNGPSKRQTYKTPQLFLQIDSASPGIGGQHRIRNQRFEVSNLQPASRNFLFFFQKIK